MSLSLLTKLRLNQYFQLRRNIMNNTELELEAALGRLLNGAPLNTPNDGKINIKRINDEAGLTKSNIYHYKEFVERAKTTIAKHLSNTPVKQSLEHNEEDSQAEINKLKVKLKNEQRLKGNYLKSLNVHKLMTDKLVIENVSMAFRILELEDKNRSLDHDKIARLWQSPD